MATALKKVARKAYGPKLRYLSKVAGPPKCKLRPSACLWVEGFCYLCYKIPDYITNFSIKKV